MRWTWIMVRGAVFPACALLLGFAGFRFFGAFASLGPTVLADAGRWASWSLSGGFAAFLILWAVFVWRLWRWEQGSGPSCGACHGPLGRLRPGKVYYGRQLSDYRRCYNCGKANSRDD